MGERRLLDGQGVARRGHLAAAPAQLAPRSRPLVLVARPATVAQRLGGRLDVRRPTVVADLHVLLSHETRPVIGVAGSPVILLLLWHRVQLLVLRIHTNTTRITLRRLTNLPLCPAMRFASFTLKALYSKAPALRNYKNVVVPLWDVSSSKRSL